jgi:hypothetical protein
MYRCRVLERAFIACWLAHGMVPLELWITAPEARMCAAVKLDLDDYTRWVGPVGSDRCLQ